MMLTHCGNNVRNRYSGCVFSVKDIVPVPLKTSRNLVVVSIPLSGMAEILLELSYGDSGLEQMSREAMALMSSST